MINVLVFTGKHLDSGNANAQCVKPIVEYLSNCQDIHVDIVYSEAEENTKKLAWYQDLSNLFLRILYWPSTMPKKISQMVKASEELMQKREYTYIIAAHKPYEGIVAMKRIKKSHSSVKTILYEIDPMVNQIDEQLGFGKHLFFLTKASEKRAYKFVDHIYHMRCNEKQFSREEYLEFRNKSSFLDFPKITNCGHQSFEAKPVHYPVKMIYSGVLDKKYRSPDYLLKLLDLVSGELQIQADFHTKGNCQEDLQAASQKNASILSYGYIPKDELEKKVDEAEFLLNIGNRYSCMLPSKVLEYINTGKPIIHISSQDNDACISYLQKYGNALILHESEDIQKNKETLICFCKTHFGKRIASQTIYELFGENTPEYSGKAILAFIKNNIST